ncbi:MAG TPA: MlaD family protein [Planctomycetota bacterium]
MTAPANRWKLGLFVVAGGVATVTGLTVVGMSEFKRSYHTAYAYFDEALTGLEEGSPVKFRGVRIGVVEQIRVATDKKHLEVRASLYDTYLEDLGLHVSLLEDECPLPENLRAQVVMSWVTGTSFIQVDFFPDPSSGPQRLPFQVGRNTLRTVPSAAKGLEDASREVLRELPLMALSARELLDQLRSDLQAARVPELAAELRSVLGNLDDRLAELREHGTVAAATAAMASVTETATFLRDENGPVAGTMRELQQLAASLRTQIEAASVAETASSMRSAAGSLSGLGADVRSELPQLRATLAAVERLATLLERDPEALLRGRGGLQRPLEGQK